MADSVLRDFEVYAPPPIPPFPLEPEDAPLVEGEVVVYPAPRGHVVELRFAGPYEPFLTLDGERVVDARGPEQRRLLTWIGQRLPPLYHAFEHDFGLCAVLTERGVEVTDVVNLETGERSDHAGVRQRLFESDVLLPPLAILGPVSGLSELQTRIRSMYASGTLLEVRREESRRVLGRRQVRVGR